MDYKALEDDCLYVWHVLSYIEAYIASSTYGVAIRTGKKTVDGLRGVPASLGVHIQFFYFSDRIIIAARHASKTNQHIVLFCLRTA